MTALQYTGTRKAPRGMCLRPVPKWGDLPGLPSWVRRPHGVFTEGAGESEGRRRKPLPVRAREGTLPAPPGETRPAGIDVAVRLVLDS